MLFPQWPALATLVFTTTTTRAASSSASNEVRIFIDQVTDYQLLASCAEYEVSTVVRDMSAGCGDDQQTTSFACFCLMSSVIYKSKISSKVLKACPNETAQVTTATDVFHEYCEQGKIVAGGSDSVTTQSTISSTASPASGPPTVYITSTSTSQSGSSEKKTPVVAIAVGVTVPVVVIALGIGFFFLYRQKKNKHQEPIELANADDRTPGGSIPYSGSEILSSPVYELKQGTAPLVELDGGRPTAELEASTSAKNG